MRARPPNAIASRRRQAGSVLVNAAIALGVVLIGLASAEIGYLFYLKRELQKAADMAALAGARWVTASTACTQESSAALGNANGSGPADARRNMPPGFSLVAADVACGTWVESNTTASTDACFEGTVDHFTPGNGANTNAVRVRIRRDAAPLMSFFGGTRRICVQAVAAVDEPNAVFSVGSKLIDNNPAAPLMSLLRTVGLNTNTLCLACYNGLAGVQISPSGLLQALGVPVATDLSVGALNTLLAAQKLTVAQVINAIVTVAGQDSLLAANATLLNALVPLSANVDDLRVQLGTDPAQNNGARGLFAQITAPTTSAALAAKVDALGLLTAAVGVGVSDHAVTVPVSSSLLGLSVEARVIEPPSVGIGGEGTKAYNSQVRVVANIDTGGSALGGLLGALGTQVKLPITLDVVNAQATLQDLDCGASPPRATLLVEAPILNACIGNNSAARWSKVDACGAGDLHSMTLVELLGAPVLSGKVHVEPLANDKVVVVEEGQTVSTAANNLQVGTTVSELLDEVLKLSLGASAESGQPADRVPTPALAAMMADNYLKKVSPGGTALTATQMNQLVATLTADNMTWNRPTLLNLVTQPMPDEFKGAAAACVPFLGNTYNYSCVRGKLVDELQTANQGGLLSTLLGGLLNLVSGLLGLGPGDAGTPLLSTVLGPLVDTLLQPLLDGVGAALSNLLSNTLGLELGRSDVHLQSVSCRNSKLVY